MLVAIQKDQFQASWLKYTRDARRPILPIVECATRFENYVGRASSNPAPVTLGSPYLPVQRAKANRFAESVAQALTHAGLPQGQSLRSADMLRLGMGLGITLGANGWLKGDEDHTGGDEDEAARRWPKRSSAKYGLGKSGTVEMSLAPPVIKVGALCDLYPMIAFAAHFSTADIAY